MSRLALLALGLLIGIALVLVPLHLGWISGAQLESLARVAPTEQPPAPASPASEVAIAPAASSSAPAPGFPATDPLALPPPPPVADAVDPRAGATPIGNLTQTPPPSTRPEASAPLPLPPGVQPLLMPVKGVDATQISDTFTQSRGAGRKHDAIDIMAPRGTPVLAVDDGHIEKLFLSVPGGRTIYQFDRDGQRAYYYAHLDAYAPNLSEGDPVRRGQVIGYVGSTGNASPDAPHLHFAIFELDAEKHWWEGTAINPYPMLGGR